jgi:hypothetical protein
MSEEWTPSAYVARAMSTRPVQIKGTDYTTVVTREALEGMAAQVAADFIPIVIEHLSYIPPIGRWHSGEVIQAPDGEFELELRGSALRQLVPADEDPPNVLGVVDELPAGGSVDLTAELRYEARNFDSDANQELQADTPFPLKEEHKWSELPPLIWTLSIPVVWGAIKFAGSFFEALGKESGEAVAQWIRAAWDRSKEPDRDRMLSIEFLLDDGSVIYGFIPSGKDDDGTHAELLGGLDEAGTLASFAGLQQERGALPGMKRAAFLFLDGTWHLAWWTDGESVFRMRWFDDHMPDPAGFLGRPLLGTDVDVKPPSEVEE